MHLFRHIDKIKNCFSLKNLSFLSIRSLFFLLDTIRFILSLIHPIMTRKWFNFLPTSLWLDCRFFQGHLFFSFAFLLYLILHNFVRALCRKTRLKQIVCVHTSDTCEELYVCVYASFTHSLFSSLCLSHSLIILKKGIPIWIRSSPLR